MDSTIDPMMDASWLDASLPTLADIDLAPEGEAEVARFTAWAVALASQHKTKRAIREAMRKREDPNGSPTKKISVRIPRPVLDLLRRRAAECGLPYQTLANVLIAEGLTR